jgi:uncharacterized protein YkwD
MEQATDWPGPSVPSFRRAGLLVPLLMAASVLYTTGTAILAEQAQPAPRPHVAPPATGAVRPALHPLDVEQPSQGAVARSQFDLLNADRSLAGLPPLIESRALDAIAGLRAAQLAQTGLSHYLPGHSVSAAVELLQQAAIAYRWHGENIAWEAGQPAVEVPTFFNDWWMGSPEHRANILSANYRQVGIGLAEQEGRVYMVEDFID